MPRRAEADPGVAVGSLSGAPSRPGTMTRELDYLGKIATRNRGVLDSGPPVAEDGASKPLRGDRRSEDQRGQELLAVGAGRFFVGKLYQAIEPLT